MVEPVVLAEPVEQGGELALDRLARARRQMGGVLDQIFAEGVVELEARLLAGQAAEDGVGAIAVRELWARPDAGRAR